MKRILIVADDPTLVTGYARLGRFLSETLSTEYEVRYLPCNASNPNHDRKFKYLVDSFEPSERYNNKRIGDILQSFQPSLVIVIGEFIYIGYIGNVCRQLGIKSMYYMPVEGLNFPPHIVYVGQGQVDYKLTLSKFDYIVAYSNFGKEQIHKQLPGIVTEVIYHPINTEIFRPLDRERCRKMYLAHLVDNPDTKNFFIVGAVYRNMRRKGVDYLIKGFRSFVDKYEKDRKAFLFLLMDYRESAGFNLYQMLEQHNLKDRFILVPSVGGINGPDDHGLCELYNTFDVHVCPFRAGGFELPPLESLACGVRTICTNFSSPAEWAKGVADFVDPIDTEPIVSTNCEWAVLDYKDVSKAMANIYNEKSEVYQKGVDLAKSLSEKNIALQWLRLLRDLNLPDKPHEKVEQAKSVRENIIETYVDLL
jgi:glycosyltransferase involved in cell wall biosynthesis